MPDIVYSAVLQSAHVAAEVGEKNDPRARGVSMRDVAISIASQAQSKDIVCVTTNRMTVYYVKRANYTVVAIASENAPPRVLIAFLKEVENGLRERRESMRISATADIIPSDYQSVLQQSFENIEANRDSLRVARSEMDQVKQIMVENIDRLLERGERVNLLVDRTGEMSNSANIFNRQATHLQRKMWFQNIKVTIIGALLLIGSCYGISRAI